jgi:hypothetical protein
VLKDPGGLAEIMKSLFLIIICPLNIYSTKKRKGKERKKEKEKET